MDRVDGSDLLDAYERGEIRLDDEEEDGEDGMEEEEMDDEEEEEDSEEDNEDEVPQLVPLPCKTDSEDEIFK